MIYDPQNRHRYLSSPIISHITGEISSMCGNDFSVTFDNTEELARAVEYFIQADKKYAAIDSQHLMILTSQALSSLGEGLFARRLLILGTGLVAPAEWQMTGDKAMWILDLKRMTVRSDVGLELILFNALNVILDSIADVWDETDGHGFLGLRHVCRTASALLGKSKKDKTAQFLAAEIKGRCEKRLEQIGRDREWKRAPDVVNLDV